MKNHQIYEEKSKVLYLYEDLLKIKNGENGYLWNGYRSTKNVQSLFQLLEENLAFVQKILNFPTFSTTKSQFSCRQSSENMSRMPSKLIQAYSVKSGDVFRYPQRLVSTSRSEYMSNMKNGKNGALSSF